jgi:hypothetical protein
MSARQVSTEGSDASSASQTSGAPSAAACILQSQWRQERLTEARGIVADIAHHPDTLVLLACRVICAQSADTPECADALGLIGLLGTSSPKTGQCVPEQWCRMTLRKAPADDAQRTPYSPSKPWRVGS